MALITEDGTGLTTAESLASVSAATTYHSVRGNAAWALLTNAQMEEALRRATDYMEQIYRFLWAGYRKTTTQALSWPREQVPVQDAGSGYGTFPAYYSNTAVPTIVVNACAELALKASAATLFADQTQKVVSESVGPISVDYDRYSPQEKRYVAIDAMLSPFLASIKHEIVRT